MSEKTHHGHKWMPVMYANFFGILQEIANRHGYALAAHGSFTRDMDLIAVPWTEEAGPHLEMLREMFAVIGWSASDDVPYHGPAEQKPHGRIAYTIHTGAGGYVDISIMETKPLRAAALH